MWAAQCHVGIQLSHHNCLACCEVQVQLDWGWVQLTYLECAVRTKNMYVSQVLHLQ